MKRAGNRSKQPVKSVKPAARATKAPRPRLKQKVAALAAGKRTPGTSTAATTAPMAPVRVWALLAHGAGGHKDHPHVAALAACLQAAGLPSHRFNFPYRAEGRGFPDRMPALVEAFRTEALAVVGNSPAAVAGSAGKGRGVFLCGHSMGCRAAVALAASGFPCRGLVLFSYPLHPPSQPTKLRFEHLSPFALGTVPVLSISGTRDAFCTTRLMDAAVSAAGAAWTHRWVDGACHSLEVLQKSGRSREDVLGEVSEAIRGWLATLPR